MMKERIQSEIQSFDDAVYGPDVKKTYIDIAKTVCIDAMEKLDGAVEQGNFAESQGNYAKNQGEFANTKGGYANAQGDYSKAQGDYAKAQGDRTNNVLDDCIEQTGECTAATQASQMQTVLCDESTKKANEAATGHSIIYDPSDGCKKTIQESVNGMWTALVKMFGSPLTAAGYDALKLTAAGYDAKKITAYEYDTRGGAILKP